MNPFLLFLIGFFSISQLGYHFWPQSAFPLGIRVDYLSPTLYFTDLLLIFFCLFNFKLLIKNRQIPLFVFAFLLVNIIFSLDPLFSLYQWLRIALLTSTALLLSSFTHKKIKPLLHGLLFATIFSCALAIAQSLTSASLGGPSYWLGERSFTLSTPGIARLDTCFSTLCIFKLRPYATFSHPNSLAGFLLVSSLILYHFKNIFNKKLLYSSFVLIFITLLLTFSRAALLFLLFIPVLLFLSKKNKLKALLLLPLLTIPLLIISFILPSAFPKAISERLLLNTLSLQITLQHPLGTGLGNYLLAQTKLINPLSIKSLTLLNQPVHNIYLLLLSELGILAPIILLPFFKHNFKNKSVLLFALLAILLTGLFDHYWLTLPQNRLLLAILLALIFKR